MTAIHAVRIFSALGIAMLLVLIVISSLEMSLWNGLKATVDTHWGLTTMVDLYLGLFVAAGWIAHRERSVARTLGWLVGLCLLGNLTLLVYLLRASLRARTIDDLFRPAA
ncbi:MAG: DUF1475 family protein [Planctomycetota bacterium]|nr:DUF1475 family protein [Planctomycetota bacterium]